MKPARLMKTVSFQPLARGDKVGEYEVEASLGAGGHGLVFKVRRAGLPFALKLLRGRSLEARGQREISILRRIQHPNVVGFHACGRWPHPVHGPLYFVMDFVEGRTLEQWALEDNPCARCVARVLLELARALAHLHARGVLHRDLKLENILLRTSDGAPVLVDFGIGWLAEEPPLTQGTLPPCTAEYRSPEALRFARAHTGGQARYVADAGDELWALGVLLYWLLTDMLPFGRVYQRGQPLDERILTQRPKAPHEVNPRVPRALGELCQRMLEKRRQARYGTCEELARALEAALAGADGSWDVPLVDPDAPEHAFTEEEPGLVPRSAEEREMRRWSMGRPRRGAKARHPPAPEGGGATVVAPPAVVEEEAEPAPAGEEPESAAGAPHVPEAAPSPVDAAAPLPVAAEEAARGVPPPLEAPGPVHRARVLPGGGVSRVGAVALAAGLLLSAWLLAGSRVERGPVGTPGVAAPTAAPSPPGWEVGPPTSPPGIVREVAAPGGPSEAGGGAAPLVASTPALTTAMPLRKQESRLPPQEMPVPALQPQGGRCKKWQCLAASCGWVLVACTGPQVRATPGPEDCPAGAMKTMREELSLGLSDDFAADIPPGTRGERVTVRAGDAAVTMLYKVGELDEGTVLTGRFILGKERLYGRFTRAQTPQGKTYPVCMEIAAPGGAGEPIKSEVGSDAVKVHARVRVYVTDQFE
ncbi:MAG TPA: protein kinase [Archangium sp.]|uniref:serine/threonine protein kinase n=1 Tax=Archangium sp. TaxID=1872627 RepID=UPI002E37A5DD|nr:protein kinase [Archangium sp.]HEX5750294.1 protein kinase [Archangium sp.]